ncbi:PrsW family intramembrane metalloprotease [Salinifilum ghardaiensis]
MSVARPFLFIAHNRGVRAWALMVALSAVMIATLALTGDDVLQPAAFLIGAAAGPVGLLVATHRRTEVLNSVPAGTMLLTMVVGGAFALLVGGVFDTLLITRVNSWKILYVGPIEEIAKLILPVALALTGRYLTKLSGVALGMAAATGFAVLESMGYAYGALNAPGGLAGAETDLIMRGLTDPFTHQIWTGAACAVMFAAWQRRGRVSLSWSVVAILATVMALHSVFDLMQMSLPLPPLVTFPLTLLVMIPALVLFLRVTRDLTTTRPGRVPEQRSAPGAGSEPTEAPTESAPRGEPQ